MSIFDVFSLCGGLGLFLYGMKLMSEGLEQVAGDRMPVSYTHLGWMDQFRLDLWEEAFKETGIDPAF